MKEGHADMRGDYTKQGPRNDFTGITPAKSGRYGAAKCDVAIRHSRGPHVRACLPNRLPPCPLASTPFTSPRFSAFLRHGVQVDPSRSLHVRRISRDPDDADTRRIDATSGFRTRDPRSVTAGAKRPVRFPIDRARFSGKSSTGTGRGRLRGSAGIALSEL